MASSAILSRCGVRVRLFDEAFDFTKESDATLAMYGLQRGQTPGSADSAWRPVKDPVHVNDLQATILHLLRFDHERLTFRYAGRDHRLTDLAGKVVHAILSGFAPTPTTAIATP